MDNQDLSYTAHIFVASISGIVNILITTPLWVATTRLTMQDRQQEKEQQLITEELKTSGKPAEISEKISIGKINKFKEENSLMSQDWVMDPKKKVKDIMSELNIEGLKIKEFTRIKIGE